MEKGLQRGKSRSRTRGNTNAVIQVRGERADLERESKKGAKFSDSGSILEGESITLSHRGDKRGEIKEFRMITPKLLPFIVILLIKTEKTGERAGSGENTQDFGLAMIPLRC